MCESNMCPGEGSASPGGCSPEHRERAGLLLRRGIVCTSFVDVCVCVLCWVWQGVHRAPTSVEALEAAFQDRYSALKRVYEQRLHGLVAQVGARCVTCCISKRRGRWRFFVCVSPCPPLTHHPCTLL